ncbi:MAG: hypothetical protein NZL93_06915 [Chthoniobacterales bacterium]|nr:hypothetical protein [Chthoniobacterales bacterium]
MSGIYGLRRRIHDVDFAANPGGGGGTSKELHASPTAPKIRFGTVAGEDFPDRYGSLFVALFIVNLGKKITPHPFDGLSPRCSRLTAEVASLRIQAPNATLEASAAGSPRRPPSPGASLRPVLHRLVSCEARGWAGALFGMLAALLLAPLAKADRWLSGLFTRNGWNCAGLCQISQIFE